MQPCFLEECKDTEEKVRLLGEGFRFVLLSDSHMDPQNPQWVARQMHTYENIKAVCGKIKPEAIFHLGDLLYARNDRAAEEFLTDAKVDELFASARGQLLQASENAFFVAGNHDERAVEEPIREKYFRRLVQPQRHRITGLVENEPYYYVDFPEKQVRCICLMSSFQENGEQRYGFYKEQMDWLSGRALLAPDGWRILLFCHIYPGQISAQSYSKDNIDVFLGMLHAFQNKTCFSSPVCSGDFRNTTTARLIAMFVGHSHADWEELPGRLPCPVVMIGCNHVHMPSDEPDWPLPEGCRVPRRAYDTVTEDLWDVVVLQEDTLHTVRFGAGEDRRIGI